MPWRHPFQHLADMLDSLGWNDITIEDSRIRWHHIIRASYDYGADEPLVMQFSMRHSELYDINSDADSLRIAMRVGDSFNERLVAHVRSNPPQTRPWTHHRQLSADRPSAPQDEVFRAWLSYNDALSAARSPQGREQPQQPPPEPAMAVQMASPAEARLDEGP